MRRSFFIAILLVTFSISTLIGFRVAFQTTRNSILASHPASATQNQRTILIHVDRLDTDHPELKSVWAAVYFQSEDQTVLSFIPIYPAPTGQPSTNSLAQSFNLNKNGEPAAAFWRRLDSHQILWDSYVVVDDKGFEISRAWLFQQMEISMISASKDPGLPGSEYLDLGCRAIQRDLSAIATLDPSLLTDHFQADVPLEELEANWQAVLSGERPVKCEIVQNE